VLDALLAEARDDDNVVGVVVFGWEPDVASLRGAQ
jgi:hypothetical protein